MPIEHSGCHFCLYNSTNDEYATYKKDETITRHKDISPLPFDYETVGGKGKLYFEGGICKMFVIWYSSLNSCENVIKKIISENNLAQNEESFLNFIFCANDGRSAERESSILDFYNNGIDALDHPAWKKEDMARFKDDKYKSSDCFDDQIVNEGS